MRPVESVSQVCAPIWLLGLLAAQTFSAFLTGTKFLPVRNNLGIFEIMAALLFAGMLHYYYQHNLPIRFPTVVVIILAMMWFAIISQFKVSPDRFAFSFTQLLILIFMLVIVFLFYNVIVLNPAYLVYFGRVFGYTVAIVGLWILADGLTSDSIGAAGPMRNRVHVGTYMLTAFWIVLVFLFWPGFSWYERIIFYLALALALYGVAIFQVAGQPISLLLLGLSG